MPADTARDTNESTSAMDSGEAAELREPAGHARVQLPAEPTAMREARRHLRHTLELAGLSPARQQDALLLTSELVSNALKHGSRRDDPIEVIWRIEQETLHVAVLDAARGAAVPVALTPSEERAEGHGLRIVDQLADWWDERIVDGRREVSFRLQL